MGCFNCSWLLRCSHRKQVDEDNPSVKKTANNGWPDLTMQMILLKQGRKIVLDDWLLKPCHMASVFAKSSKVRTTMYMTDHSLGWDKIPRQTLILLQQIKNKNHLAMHSLTVRGIFEGWFHKQLCQSWYGAWSSLTRQWYHTIPPMSIASWQPLWWQRWTASVFPLALIQALDPLLFLQTPYYKRSFGTELPTISTTCYEENYYNIPTTPSSDLHPKRDRKKLQHQ